MKPEPEDHWNSVNWQEFDQETFDQLEKVNGGADMDAKVDHAAEAARKKDEQKHQQRGALFNTIRGCLVATLAASAAIMGFYMWSQWGEISSAVMISWNAAIVVNTIGLAFIVATYLFPSGERE